MTTNSDPKCLVRHRLRVLTGPLQGTHHRIGQPFRIGRTDTAELQLLDDRVSRHHAQLVLDPDGRHVLEDLGSNNGTTYRGRAVDRVRLLPNSVFRIERHSFLFEPEPAVVGTYETRLRVHQGEDGPGHADPSQARGLGAIARVFRSRGRSSSRHEGTVPIEARYPNQVPYVGNPIEDITECQRLESSLLRQQLEEPPGSDRLEELMGRLCFPSHTPTRLGGPQLYARLLGDFPGCLRLPSGAAWAVTVHELGIDGARVWGRSAGLNKGTTGWLTFDLATGPLIRTVSFTVIVEWSNAGELGLSFVACRHSSSLDVTLESVGIPDAPRMLASEAEAPVPLAEEITNVS